MLLLILFYHYLNKYSLISVINGPFATNGHMVQNPPCWRASYALGHPKQRKFKLNSDEVALFWMSQCVACSPAWWILYHVTASCKGPILLFITCVTFYHNNNIVMLNYYFCSESESSSLLFKFCMCCRKTLSNNLEISLV